MENFICSNCNYSLTIKKTSDAKTNIVVIENPTKFIDYYRTRRDENNQLDIKFQSSNLIDHLDKLKNEADKKSILTFFMYNFRKNISKYNLVCSTCGHEYVLNPETVIYSPPQNGNHSFRTNYNF